ncbi:cyclin-dependent kinase-like 1 isoform X2 [Aethina tumida]|uniref:cyclin-dependent kinase-like 1 isoform X2 n=1 Tax=Aethina tumida TaxID=116153 RepID=UPI0021487BBC|nr:cyclin-dependent kinase-like 1 isoform X2 [Aethina tumida]
MEKYEQISVVGEGSYGVVLKCRHRETDQIVAVKKFLETEEDATIRKMALREIRMLKRLKHENLVTMIEVFRYKKRFYLVFEYLEGTVLDELDKIQGGLGDERSRERIFQVARAISYCHSNHIIHRDVKPENVLVSSLGVVKLCDFGFARHVSNSEVCTEYVATRWYRAPELLVGDPNYGAPVDIWAIGCLFAEMVTGDPLFPGESDIDQLFLIVKMLGKPCVRHQQLMLKNTQLKPMIKAPTSDNCLYKAFPLWSLQAIDFLSGCVKMDPNQRLTAEDILKHSYFTHDRFPQRFLPAIREKVNAEFNSPLLRKFKTEILMSTDKKDEIKPRRFSNNDQRWRFTLHEGSMKRKLSCDTLSNDNEKNLISLSKSSQRLNLTQKPPLMKQTSIPPPNKEKSGKQQQNGNNTAEMQMLEKSLESLAKFSQTKEETRSLSAQKELTPSPLLRSSPPEFQSLHFSVNECHKSQSTHSILHPSISNISFSKDPPKKSPSILQNRLTTQVPLLSKSQFLKKMERPAVIENMFDDAPLWLNSFTLKKKKEVKPKSDDFVLPNLPGASGSPGKPRKKSLQGVEDGQPTEVTPRIITPTIQKSPLKTFNGLI